MAWSKEDRVRWVEWRLNERISVESGRFPDRDLDADGVPDRISLEVWLAKERDGLSWQQIVIRHFPQYVTKERLKSAGMSKARRSHMLVERALSLTPKQSFRLMLDKSIQHLFGCTPQQFKKYIESIPTRKRGK